MTAPSFLSKQVPVLFGTTPPMKRSPTGRGEELFWQNVHLLERLGDRVDGVLVYDVWEGNERGKFRTKYGDNRPFAERLRKTTGKEQFITNVVVHQPSLEGFGKWLDDTARMEFWNQVYVGASTERFRVPGPHPSEAYTYASNRFDGKANLGAITIPWRFREGTRVAKKVERGVRFCISQIVLESVSAIKLMDELKAVCDERDLQVPLIFWNFAPVVNVDVALEDFEFFEVFPAPENPTAHGPAHANWRRIADSDDPFRESIAVAAENLDAILRHALDIGVPAGIAVEGLGAQNLPYVEALARELLKVREKALAAPSKPSAAPPRPATAG